MTRWVTFDCYGTLIDWELGISATFARLWPDADPARLLTRYHEVEPLVQRGSGAAYRSVLASALRGVAEAEQLSLPDEEAGALARSLPDWPPFPEVPRALTQIRDRGWRIAVLSNTDPDLLNASIARLGVDVDERITVAESGSYKPAPGHWDRFFERTGADRSRHVHVGASLFHDIEPGRSSRPPRRMDQPHRRDERRPAGGRAPRPCSAPARARGRRTADTLTLNPTLQSPCELGLRRAQVVS